MNHEKGAKSVVLVGILLAMLYLGSFPLPAIDFGPMTNHDRLHGVMGGIQVFLLALFGVLAGRPIWFANPVFWVGVVLLCFRRTRAAAVCGSIAFLLASEAWCELALNSWFGTGSFLFDSYSDARLLIGYYVWLVSSGMLFLAGLWFGQSSRTPPPDS